MGAHSAPSANSLLETSPLFVEIYLTPKENDSTPLLKSLLSRKTAPAQRKHGGLLTGGAEPRRKARVSN